MFGVLPSWDSLACYRYHRGHFKQSCIAVDAAILIGVTMLAAIETIGRELEL